MKYYAIKDDTHKLIVESWEDAQNIIKECIAPKYKSFSTYEEADDFLNDRVTDDGITEPKCYIDGSFNADTGCYGFGGVLILDGKVYEFRHSYEPDDYSSQRNVAGEIKGAGYVIQYSVNHGIDTLHIFYDYMGIEKWFTGEWKASSPIGVEYQKFAFSIKDKINVIFHKVKGHTNNFYNEMADKLAKESVGLLK